MNHLFIDGITNITFHSGVLRIECATIGPDGKTHPSGTLIIPGPSAAPVLQALIKGTQEVDKKLREAAQAQQQPTAGNA
jgi:hypothetical protein